jgi:hypothetical protein
MTLPGQQPVFTPTYGSTLPKSSAGGRVRSIVLSLLAIVLIGGVGYGVYAKLQRPAQQNGPAPAASTTTVGIKPVDEAIAAACTANKQAVTTAVQLYRASHGNAPQGADDRARIQVLVAEGILREAPPTNAGYQILLSPTGEVSADHC